MRNFVQEGNVVTLTAPEALDSGEPFAVGAIFAIATGAAESGAPVEAIRVGVFDLPKVAGVAWTVGQRLYWASATKNVSTVATGNLFIGAALAAALSAATTGRVLLTGGPAPVPA